MPEDPSVQRFQANLKRLPIHLQAPFEGLKRQQAKIKRLLSTKAGQEAFLKETAGRAPDLSTLSVLGPLQAQRWDFEDPACPWPITAELWRREDGAMMVEASVKAPAVQAAAVMGGFMAFLAEVGAERDRQQQAKTRWALEYYAARSAKASRKV
jgi:hypothetical protein